ncbi:MAG: hypothetical protein OXM00_05445, partial [Paracoccaceae bacterium]|nr:hypothetical protein [Paracoccaceae bacterium]
MVPPPREVESLLKIRHIFSPFRVGKTNERDRIGDSNSNVNILNAFIHRHFGTHDNLMEVVKRRFGAGEEIRTPDQRLGKPMR